MLNSPSLQKNTTKVVIQQNSRKLLMMDILMSETCWAHKKWNKIASDIKLVFYSSTIKECKFCFRTYVTTGMTLMLHFPSQPLVSPHPPFNSENSPIHLPSCDVIALISREVSSAPDLQCRGQIMGERICVACLACSVQHQYACP